MAAHGQFGGVLVGDAEEVEAGVEESAPTLGEPLGRVDAAVRPDLCHALPS